jgi:hypothetical protein
MLAADDVELACGFCAANCQRRMAIMITTPPPIKKRGRLLELLLFLFAMALSFQ